MDFGTKKPAIWILKKKKEKTNNNKRKRRTQWDNPAGVKCEERKKKV